MVPFTAVLSAFLVLSAGARPTIRSGIEHDGWSVLRGASLQHTLQRRAATDGLVNMGYFADWAAYPDGLNFTADKIPTEDLTHVLYAFAGPDSTTGGLNDLRPLDEGNTPGQLGGQLGMLFELKKKQRNLKVLLSIGGWTYSDHFGFLTDPGARQTLVNDAVTWVENYGLDGIDMDYEKLQPEQEAAYIDLMKSLRDALDLLAQKKKEPQPYLLTSAIGVKPNKAIAQTAPYVDLFTVMGYDMASPGWSNATNLQSNLYSIPSENDGNSVDAGIHEWIGMDIPASKILLGQPLYAREFFGSAGLFEPFDKKNIPPQDGVVGYNKLPSWTADEGMLTINTTIGAAWAYNPDNKTFLAYDVPDITRIKSQYILDNKLAGASFWDLSTDQTGTESIVATSATELKKPGPLDQRPNHLYYPNSKFTNVQAAASGPEEAVDPPTTVTSESPEASASPTEPPSSESQVHGLPSAVPPQSTTKLPNINCGF